MPFDLATGQWRDDPTYAYNWDNWPTQQGRQQAPMYSTYDFNQIGDGTTPPVAPDPYQGQQPGQDPNQPGYGGAMPPGATSGGYPYLTGPITNDMPGGNRQPAPQQPIYSAPADQTALQPMPQYPATMPYGTPADRGLTPLQETAGPVGTGNPGNDRNNPPGTDLQNWFWSGTANHWVDSTGKRDATGRQLSAGEQTAWQGYDTTRAQNTARGMVTPFPTDAFIQNAAGLPTTSTATPGMQTPVPVGANTATVPQSAYPKVDPAFLAQVQAALESPQGPYAGRQPGDYAPPDAPEFARNPKTLDDWNNRMYWFAQHPEALSNPSAPAVAAAAYGDNAYGTGNNTHATFAELRGVLNKDQLDAAQKMYGWLPDEGSGSTTDQNAAYQRLAQLTQADQANDYSVVSFNLGTGVQYGIVKREKDLKSQEARGYISPATAARMAQERAAAATAQAARGGGSGNTGRPQTSYNNRVQYTTPRPVATAAPQGKTTIQPGPGLDTRMVGGSVNMNKPVEGQIVTYNGKMVQFRNGRWEPLAYRGGVGQNPSPV